MNITQTIAPSLDLTLTRLTQPLRAAWQDWIAAAHVQRRHASLLDDLRGRIAQYDSQPGFASDLRAVLRQAERDLAPGAARRR